MVSRPVVRNATWWESISVFSARERCIAESVADQNCERRLEAFENLLTLLQVFVVGNQALFVPYL